jgi:very-short-patch-repair endonuclease
MQTAEPKIEQMIDAELQRRGLNRHFDFKGTVLCFDKINGLRVVKREWFTKHMAEQCREADGFFCVPDRLCSQKRLAFFFDGPPHMHRGERQRDEEQDKWLVTLGWKAVRFPYTSPSQKLVVEICDKIEEMLK